MVARSYGTCVLIRSQSGLSRDEGDLNSEVRMIHFGENNDSEDRRSLISHRQPGSELLRSRDVIEDEVQLHTLKDFGPTVRVRYGGLVTARSVKYLGKLKSNLSDQETRDGWWAEVSALRTRITKEVA